ncbi:MAG: hypothetical protein PWQ51_2598 [Methanolobus sp.]|nr:hypothetical protein [Methanolobus sp.]MDK2940433.1 hypothetical protein [Methanolobus sp.]
MFFQKEPSFVVISSLLTIISGEGFSSLNAFQKSFKIEIAFDMISVKQVVYFIYIHIKHLCKFSFTYPGSGILLNKIMFSILPYVCLNMDSLSILFVDFIVMGIVFKCDCIVFIVNRKSKHKVFIYMNSLPHIQWCS